MRTCKDKTRLLAPDLIPLHEAQAVPLTPERAWGLIGRALQSLFRDAQLQALALSKNSNETVPSVCRDGGTGENSNRSMPEMLDAHRAFQIYIGRKFWLRAYRNGIKRIEITNKEIEALEEIAGNVMGAKWNLAPITSLDLINKLEVID